jgi:hypothetical protein
MNIRENRPTLNFLDSYRAHYGAQEDLLIRRLECLTDQPHALRLELTSHRPDFRHFELAAKEAPFHASRSNTFIIRFGRETEWRGRARPVYDRSTGDVVEILIRRSACLESDKPADPLPARYTVAFNPPLEFEVRAPDDWSRPLPTASDRRFAKARWGCALKGVKGDYAQACALAKVLCRELWPHNGTPTMDYDSPFGMYRKMMAGTSKGFCVQFNMIFVHACRSLGLLARNLHVERPVAYARDAWILLSGMHCASELFDRDRNRWVFMDIRFYCLGAWLGNEGPLSLGELHLLISQPHWRKRLRFQVYDLEADQEKRVPMSRCPRPDIDFYSGWNTVFHVGYE